MLTAHRIPRLALRVLAGGAILLAAAVPLIASTEAGAAPADAIATATFTPSPGSTSGAYFGSGASGTFLLTGTFAGDGGHVSVSSTAPGLTFSSVTDTTTGPNTTVQGNFASTSATLPGSYNLLVTDDNGSATADNAFTVDAAPAVTSINPTTIADSATPGPVTATITGSGFVGTPIVTITSTVDGTQMTNSASATGGTIATPATSIPLTITPTNAANSASATIGTYTVTVTNPDGGTSTSGPIFSATGNAITSVSPSAVAVPATGTATDTLTLTGYGFESGATVSLGTCPGVAVVANSTTVASATSATFQVTVASGTLPTQCDVTITNTAPGNGDSSIAPAALGIGKASALAPVITSSSLTTGAAIVAGAPATTITFTGSGFSSFTTPLAYTELAAGTHDHDATLSGCVADPSGLTITCDIAAASGVVTGAHTALLENGSATASLANAFTVSGPSITSASPSGLVTGAPVGTVVALTGTGFTNTLQGSVATGPLAGTFEYVSPTNANFVVTTSPTIADATDSLIVSTTDSYGATTYSAPFALDVSAAPTISSITYAAGTSGVGVGAKAQPITINGTGLAAGATVTGFTNASAVADPNVTITVTGVNVAGTQATATVAVAAGDTNTLDGFTFTNANGGSVKIPALAPTGLVIDAAPTITAVSPAKAVASSTNTLSVTGTGFATGATVALSSDGTCAPATAFTATSFSVVCTIGAASTTPVTLVVTNPDGGTAVSAPILSATSVVTPPAFKVLRVVGVAAAGRTVRIALVGSGFYAAPRVTSNVAGSRVRDVADSGRVLRLLITTPARVRGAHVLTIRLANGKTARIGYRVVA